MYSGNERSALIGKAGEDFVVDFLKSKGYIIIKRNWKDSRFGELDIVAENRECIAFVEVKTRTTSFGGKRPEEYVDAIKRRRISAAANAYIKQHQIDLTPRFDIIGITMDPCTYTIVETTHIEDAFLPPQRAIGNSTFSGENRWHHRNTVIGKKR